MDAELLELFNEESKDNLELFSTKLAGLNANPADTAAAGDLFRAAHTLSGISSTVGFELMARLSKPIEHLLLPVRDGAKSLDAPTIALLGECHQALVALAAQAAADAPQAPANLDGLIGRLSAIAGS